MNEVKDFINGVGFPSFVAVALMYYHFAVGRRLVSLLALVNEKLGKSDTRTLNKENR